MAIVSLEVPNAQVARVVEMLCRYGGLEVSNANAKLVVGSLIRSAVSAQEQRIADAEAAAKAPIEGIT